MYPIVVYHEQAGQPPTCLRGLERYAQRLAPVQVAWLGSWGSAGGLFDVLLTDRDAVPASAEQHYAEAI